nr:hypothetical protein [Mycobacterium arosiense]
MEQDMEGLLIGGRAAPIFYSWPRSTTMLLIAGQYQAGGLDRASPHSPAL